MLGALLITAFFLLFDGEVTAIILGNEVLRRSGYASLIGHRVAVLSNPTGIFADSLEHIVDVMVTVQDLEVVAIFSPEHGFRGEKQAETSDPPLYIDSVTGLPVYSAYALSIEALQDVLHAHNITAVVVDMQDVGVRLYTFIWTMFDMMAAAALPPTSPFTTATKSIYKASYGDGASAVAVKFVICDRPNPLGGMLVRGPVLDMKCCASGYGRAPIPHIHGLTLGELALFFNHTIVSSAVSAGTTTERIGIEVMKMLEYDRSTIAWPVTPNSNSKSAVDKYTHTLPWVPPSPNIPTPATIIAYSATVFLEATTVAEGRGTTTPFQVFGAPFTDTQVLTQKLNKDLSGQSGACFRSTYFQPTFSKYNDTVVPGVQWLADRSMASVHDPFLVATVVLQSFQKLANPKTAFVWDGSWFGHPGTQLIDAYAGTPEYRWSLERGDSPQDIVDHFDKEAQIFKMETRKPFLLYQ